MKGFLDIAAQRPADTMIAEMLPIKVTSTVSSSSYGSRYKCRFIPGTHDEADKVWDENECSDMAENQMEWYLKRVSDPDTESCVSSMLLTMC